MEVYYVWTCSIVLRKEAAGPLLRFPEDTNIFEEWECFAQIARAGPAAYLDCELAVQNVHCLTRLTDADEIYKATARIRLLQRVWGADDSYLKVHRLHFQDVLKEQYLWRAKCLIKQGYLKKARRDLRAIGGGPLTLRLLTIMPSLLVIGLLHIRRKIHDMRS